MEYKMESFQGSRQAGPGQIVALVADDDPMVRDFARAALEKAGYFVICAGDGEEALALSRKHPGAIHALVSDVQMPKLDGFGLREQILRERPAIKVLLMSGQAANLAGELPFLRKPFGFESLKLSVNQLLSEPI
jgi:DNA-binding NtrC family response regulator